MTLPLCAPCRLSIIAMKKNRIKSSENLTRFDKNEKIMIGSVFPMNLENVEYPVIYIGDLAVNSRSGNGRA